MSDRTQSTDYIYEGIEFVIDIFWSGESDIPSAVQLTVKGDPLILAYPARDWESLDEAIDRAKLAASSHANARLVQ